MLAEGFTGTEIAFYFDVERTTLLKRCKVDPELREAFRAGRDRRRHKLVRKFYPRNTADELELLLVDLLKEIRALRRESEYVTRGQPLCSEDANAPVT